MRKHQFFIALAVCVCLIVPEIFAQFSPPASPSERYVRLTPYLWGSGFKGRVGIGDRSADVDASFTDILGELNFGFMGSLEADRDKFVTVTDLTVGVVGRHHTAIVD